MNSPEKECQSELFLELFSQSSRRIYGYILSLLPRQSDADDVFQRCSLILWKKFDTFKPDEEFGAWACGVAFYEVKNFKRSTARDRHFFSDDLIEQLSDQSLAKSEFLIDNLDALKHCVEELGPGDQRLIKSIYWENTPMSTIAESMGIIIQSLYNRISRVRTRLTRCVEQRLLEEHHERTHA